MLASGRPQATHERQRSPMTASCAETISAWSAAVTVEDLLRAAEADLLARPDGYDFTI